MMSPSEADILRYAAEVPRHQPDHFVAIGGLARSGTSSCERWLHGFDNLFVADEFHGLADPSYLAAMRFMMSYTKSEADLWRDADGRTWRGTTFDELEQRRKRALLVTLLLFTRQSKFAGKDPQRLRVFGCKLPAIEDAFENIWPIFDHRPMAFIYCARDPIDIFQSQWRVPWVGGVDAESFSSIVRHQIKVSLVGFDRVVACGGSVAIWRTPANATNATETMVRLGLAEVAGSRKLDDIRQVDEWPKERRRRVAPISTETLKEFVGSPEVEAYREKFGV